MRNQESNKSLSRRRPPSLELDDGNECEEQSLTRFTQTGSFQVGDFFRINEEGFEFRPGSHRHIGFNIQMQRLQRISEPHSSTQIDFLSPINANDVLKPVDYAKGVENMKYDENVQTEVNQDLEQNQQHREGTIEEGVGTQQQASKVYTWGSNNSHANHRSNQYADGKEEEHHSELRVNRPQRPTSSSSRFKVRSLSELEPAKLLGQGNGGSVYLARHKDTNRAVAIKCIPVNVKEDRAKQLITEVRTLHDAASAAKMVEMSTSKSDHGNQMIESSLSGHGAIVELHGAFYKDKILRLVMEYMDEGSLESVLRLTHRTLALARTLRFGEEVLENQDSSVCTSQSTMSSPLSESKPHSNFLAQVHPNIPTPYHSYEAFATSRCELEMANAAMGLSEPVIAAIAFQALEALHFLHTACRTIHRDIKPSNILINHNGHAKLADFGVAGQLLNTLDARRTFVGTVTYMCPQRIKGEAYSVNSDIWSLGVTLFECAVGAFPFLWRGRRCVNCGLRFKEHFTSQKVASDCWERTGTAHPQSQISKPAFTSFGVDAQQPQKEIHCKIAGKALGSESTSISLSDSSVTNQNSKLSLKLSFSQKPNLTVLPRGDEEGEDVMIEDDDIIVESFEVATEATTPTNSNQIGPIEVQEICMAEDQTTDLRESTPCERIAADGDEKRSSNQAEAFEKGNDECDGGVKRSQIDLSRTLSGRMGFWELLDIVLSGDVPEVPCPPFSPSFRSFISLCLTVESDKRPNAAILLQHPFIIMNLASRKARFLPFNRSAVPNPNLGGSSESRATTATSSPRDAAISVSTAAALAPLSASSGSITSNPPSTTSLSANVPSPQAVHVLSRDQIQATLTTTLSSTDNMIRQNNRWLQETWPLLALYTVVCGETDPSLGPNLDSLPKHALSIQQERKKKWEAERREIEQFHEKFNSQVINANTYVSGATALRYAATNTLASFLRSLHSAQSSLQAMARRPSTPIADDQIKLPSPITPCSCPLERSSKSNTPTSFFNNRPQTRTPRAGFAPITKSTKQDLSPLPTSPPSSMTRVSSNPTATLTPTKATMLARSLPIQRDRPNNSDKEATNNAEASLSNVLPMRHIAPLNPVRRSAIPATGSPSVSKIGTGSTLKTSFTQKSMPMGTFAPKLSVSASLTRTSFLNQAPPATSGLNEARSTLTGASKQPNVIDAVPGSKRTFASLSFNAPLLSSDESHGIKRMKSNLDLDTDVNDIADVSIEWSSYISE